MQNPTAVGTTCLGPSWPVLGQVGAGIGSRKLPVFLVLPGTLDTDSPCTPIWAPGRVDTDTDYRLPFPGVVAHHLSDF
jgi:hypothetical protein